MGIFDQFKMASEMMKNMTPDQIQTLLKQAEESKKVLEDTVKKIVDEEIRKRDLASKSEVNELISRARMPDF